MDDSATCSGSGVVQPFLALRRADDSTAFEPFVIAWREHRASTCLAGHWRSEPVDVALALALCAGSAGEESLCSQELVTIHWFSGRHGTLAELANHGFDVSETRRLT